MFLSLIIPCYNVPEKWIRRAIDSVEKQSFQDYEIIIVDDGSKPEFHTILEQIVSENANTTLIATENGGVSRARNLGIERAQGEYVAFMDADDVMTPHCFREGYSAIQKTCADLVLGGVKTTKDLETLPEMQEQSNLEYELYQNEEIRQLVPYLGCLRRTKRLDDSSYISRGPFSRFVKKRIVQETTFSERLRIGEDICWNLEVLSRCELVCVINSHWYWYWQNPDSALHRFYPTMHRETQKCIETVQTLLNLNDDQEYMTLMNLIVDCMHTVRRSIFAYRSEADPELLRSVKRSIYCDSPWTRLREWRCFRQSSLRMKLLIILYRFHLLFSYWDFRSELSK